MSAKDGERKRRFVARELKACGGKCPNCGIEIYVSSELSKMTGLKMDKDFCKELKKVGMDKHLATLDHFYPRFHIMRRLQNYKKRNRVLCKTCNEERAYDDLGNPREISVDPLKYEVINESGQFRERGKTFKENPTGELFLHYFTNIMLGDNEFPW